MFQAPGYLLQKLLCISLASLEQSLRAIREFASQAYVFSRSAEWNMILNFFRLCFLFFSQKM